MLTSTYNTAHAREGRPTQEMFQLYVLEGFLARLAISEVRDRFVLKGGVLLAAFDSRRPIWRQIWSNNPNERLNRGDEGSAVVHHLKELDRGGLGTAA